IDGVSALLIGRREAQSHPAPRHVSNNTQSQSRITVADPTLTDDKFRCFQETSASKLLTCWIVFANPEGRGAAYRGRYYNQVQNGYHGCQRDRQTKPQCRKPAGRQILA